MAFTIFLAGFAFTITTLPKISLLPAFVAGLVRVLSLHRPGTVKAPAFFTSCVATCARRSRAFAHTDFLISQEAAKASAIPLLVMARTAVAFFMGAILPQEV